jgi:hypothetical protein
MRDRLNLGRCYPNVGRMHFDVTQGRALRGGRHHVVRRDNPSAVRASSRMRRSRAMPATTSLAPPALCASVFAHRPHFRALVATNGDEFGVRAGERQVTTTSLRA